MQAPADHYATLGVERTASAEEIKASYRRLSRELHPDRNTAPDANRRMAAINDAYAVLSDPHRRAEHDRQLSRSTPRPVYRRENAWTPAATATPRAGGTPFAQARANGQVRETPRQYPRQRQPFAKPPVGGRGGLEAPGSFPDYYAFLGVEWDCDPAIALAAARALSGEFVRAHYSPEDHAALERQLREATETIASPRLRGIYLDALDGVKAPPAGTHPRWHRTHYSFLGVRPKADAMRIAEQVTALSEGMKAGTPDYVALMAAFQVLRDPARRKEYDASIGVA